MTENLITTSEKRTETMNNTRDVMQMMQMATQLRQNPMGFLQQRGYNIPQNLNDPGSIIQHLLNTGQVSQDQLNNVVSSPMAQQFRQQ